MRNTLNTAPLTLSNFNVNYDYIFMRHTRDILQRVQAPSTRSGYPIGKSQIYQPTWIDLEARTTIVSKVVKVSNEAPGEWISHLGSESIINED